MPLRALFRLLILTSLAAALSDLASATYLAFRPGAVSDTAQRALEFSGSGGLHEALFARLLALGDHGAALSIAIVGLTAVIGLTISLGLLLWWRPARPAYLLLTLLSLGALPWSGITVMLPVQTLLHDLALLCNGAILTLAYLPPISGHFARDLPPTS